MPVRQEKHVFTLPLHIERRVVIHDLEIESDEEFGASQRASGVTTLRQVYHTYNITAHLRSDTLQVLSVSHSVKIEKAARYGLPLLYIFAILQSV